MKKFRVHMYNDWSRLDEDVFVDILLPSTPRVKDYIDLGDDLYDKLESMAKSSMEILERYIPTWRWHKEELDIHFGDAMIVLRVVYEANNPIVHIEIGDEKHLDDYID